MPVTRTLLCLSYPVSPCCSKRDSVPLLKHFRANSAPALMAKCVIGLEKIHFSTKQFLSNTTPSQQFYSFIIIIIIMSFILIQENSAALTVLAFVFILTSLSPCLMMIEKITLRAVKLADTATV